MKILNKFQIEIYDKEEADHLESLGITNPESKADEMVVDLYIDLEDVESFRKTYMLGKREIECTNIITKSGETFILLIELVQFLDLYQERFGILEIK